MVTFKGSVSGQAWGGHVTLPGALKRSGSTLANTSCPDRGMPKEGRAFSISVSDSEFYPRLSKSFPKMSTRFLNFFNKKKYIHPSWVVFTLPSLNQEALSFKQMTWNFTMSECLRLAEGKKNPRVSRFSLRSNGVSAWIIGKDKKAQRKTR